MKTKDKKMSMSKPRQVVSVGWDGASKPMYRFLDELSLSDHMRERPTAEQVKAWKDWWEFAREQPLPSCPDCGKPGKTSANCGCGA